MLCDACEQRFSVWERKFAEDIFGQINSKSKNQSKLFYKGDWVLKFCVSVSWRVLQVYISKGLHTSSAKLSESQISECLTTSNSWGKYLEGDIPTPGHNEQHLIPLDFISSTNIPSLSPFMNRYIARAMDMDLLISDHSVFTYAKMGRLVLIGFVVPPYNPTAWEGTKIRLTKGQLGSSKMVLPKSLLSWINDRSNRTASMLAGISTSQQEKIRKTFINKPDETVRSDLFEAMNFDLMHSGKKAFEITKPQNGHTSGSTDKANS